MSEIRTTMGQVVFVGPATDEGACCYVTLGGSSGAFDHDNAEALCRALAGVLDIPDEVCPIDAIRQLQESNQECIDALRLVETDSVQFINMQQEIPQLKETIKLLRRDKESAEARVGVLEVALYWSLHELSEWTLFEEFEATVRRWIENAVYAMKQENHWVQAKDAKLLIEPAIAEAAKEAERD